MADETAISGTTEESIRGRAAVDKASAGRAPEDRDFVEQLGSGLAPSQLAEDEATLTVYSADQGPLLERHLPLAVVWAESVQDVQHIVRTCSAHRVPIVARGAGTGVSGGAHATRGCIVLSLERMKRILDLNPDDETAVVEPGVINAELNAAAAAHGSCMRRTRRVTRCPRLAATWRRTPAA